jgi:hypothetical protein
MSLRSWWTLAVWLVGPVWVDVVFGDEFALAGEDADARSTAMALRPSFHVLLPGGEDER